MEKQNIQVIKRLTRSNGSALADAELWEKTLWEEEHGWLRFGGLASAKQNPRRPGGRANCQLQHISFNSIVGAVDLIVHMMAQLVRSRRDP